MSTRTSADRLADHSRNAVLAAARVYAEITERGESNRCEPLVAGARLRLAAKAMLAAERAASESHGLLAPAPRGPAWVAPLEHGASGGYPRRAGDGGSGA